MHVQNEYKENVDLMVVVLRYALCKSAGCLPLPAERRKRYAAICLADVIDGRMEYSRAADQQENQTTWETPP